MHGDVDVLPVTDGEQSWLNLIVRTAGLPDSLDREGAAITLGKLLGRPVSPQTLRRWPIPLTAHILKTPTPSTQYPPRRLRPAVEPKTMSNQSTLIDDLKNARAVSDGPCTLWRAPDRAHETGPNEQPLKSDPEARRTAVAVRYPTAQEASPAARYLAEGVDLETLPIPFARFPGIKMVVPDREDACAGWSAFAEEIAPNLPPVVERKDQVPYYIAGKLKNAELKNAKLRGEQIRKGLSTVGKQRSSAHIDMLGPAVFLDDDGDVFSRVPSLKALGATAVVYSSHSYGFVKGDTSEPARGGGLLYV
jgi:hypothetical protein